MTEQAIQDLYPLETSHCFGCGYSNADGHQLKSYWNGDAAMASFTPDTRYSAIPGIVYGGLIASLIDCHGTATAAAAACQAAKSSMGVDPLPRFVTGGLKVDYLKPTPQGVQLDLRGVAIEIKDRKVVVEVSLHAGAALCAKGVVIAVRLPEAMLSGN